MSTNENDTNETKNKAKIKAGSSESADAAERVFLYRLCPVVEVESIGIGGSLTFRRHVGGAGVVCPWYLTKDAGEAQFLRKYRIGGPSVGSPGGAVGVCPFDVVEGTLIEAVGQALDLNLSYGLNGIPATGTLTPGETRRLDPSCNTDYSIELGSPTYPIGLGRRLTEEEYDRARTFLFKNPDQTAEATPFTLASEEPRSPFAGGA